MAQLDAVGYPNYLLEWDVKGQPVIYSLKSRWGPRKRLIKQFTTCHGYLTCTLIDGKRRKTFGVHRLAATVAYGGPFDTLVVNHKNGNKKDNSAANLEWCTMEYNHNHAIATGLKQPPKPKRKLTDQDYQDIRKSPLGPYALARQYGVIPATITNVRRTSYAI